MTRAAAGLLLIAFALAACRPERAPAGAAETGPAFPGIDRPVADIVSPEFASAAERDRADEAGQVVRLAGIGPGQVVADIGAGSGYHTTRLSRVVGPEGLVIAVDVVPEYLAALRDTVRRQGLENVEFVQGRPDDPRLPRNSIDTAVLAHMYHEVGQPYAFLWNLAPSVRAGGKVVVLDVERPIRNHGMPPEVMRCEFEAVGYRRVALHQLQGEVGYMAVFEPPAELPEPSQIRSCRTGESALAR